MTLFHSIFPLRERNDGSSHPGFILALRDIDNETSRTTPTPPDPFPQNCHGGSGISSSFAVPQWLTPWLFTKFPGEFYKVSILRSRYHRLDFQKITEKLKIKGF